jgi:hypothetical protein
VSIIAFAITVVVVVGTPIFNLNCASLPITKISSFGSREPA